MNPDFELELSRCLFQEANDGFVVVHPSDLRIIEANPSAQRMTGLRRKQLLELTLPGLLQCDGQTDVSSLIESCRLTNYGVYGDGFLLQRNQLPPLPVHLTVSRLHLQPEPLALIILRDLSDRVAAEEQHRAMAARLMEAQRLESLGVLSGGIAHDFNNLLTGILGFIALGLETSPVDSVARKSMQRAEQTAIRARELVRQMLIYAGKVEIQMQSVDLSHVVTEISQLLSAVISPSARLVLNLDDDLPKTACDVTQVRQILMNLLMNASDAIGELPGEIRMSTSQSRITQLALLPNQLGEALAPGDYVVLEVADSGCGMSSDTLRRIFDPFFTTKFTGRGLGLASVIGIVKAHQGALSVRSELGQGSTFTVWLPIKELTVEATLSQPQKQPSPPAVGREVTHPKSKTILIVDDEPSIRDVIGLFFERAGLRGIVASSGEEGIALCRQHALELDLVVLDMLMPTLSGTATLQEIRLIRPNVPAIFISGYAERDVADQLAGLNAACFLQKPFPPSVLVATIQRILNS